MDFERMKAFQDRLTGWRIPGNDCLITKDGETVYRYRSGWADAENKRPMRGDELYYFWSASKVITTSLALRLHEQGAFIMEDPLYEYMPEFKDMTVKKTIDGHEEIVPAENPIRIRHLFKMTAGFDYNFNSPAIRQVRKDTDGRCPTREVARAIAASPLCFEPGKGWRYSLCHDVLGALVEVLAGKRLRDYAREVLFDPLGMNDTCYNLPPEEKRDRFAVQYHFRNDENRYVPSGEGCDHILGPDYDSGGAGIVSTCADYARFTATVSCGGTSPEGYRYLSPQTVRLWHSDALDPDERAAFSWMSGYSYGFGVRTMVNPAAAGSLAPIGEFGWGGAAGVWVIIDPENRVSLTYTQHMLNNQEPFIGPRLRNILYACL